MFKILLVPVVISLIVFGALLASAEDAEYVNYVAHGSIVDQDLEIRPLAQGYSIGLLTSTYSWIVESPAKGHFGVALYDSGQLKAGASFEVHKGTFVLEIVVIRTSRNCDNVIIVETLTSLSDLEREEHQPFASCDMTVHRFDAVKMSPNCSMKFSSMEVRGQRKLLVEANLDDRPGTLEFVVEAIRFKGHD